MGKLVSIPPTMLKLLPDKMTAAEKHQEFSISYMTISSTGIVLLVFSNPYAGLGLASDRAATQGA